MSPRYTLEHYKLANRLFNRAEAAGTLKPSKTRLVAGLDAQEKERVVVYETRPIDYLDEAHERVSRRRQRYEE